DARRGCASHQSGRRECHVPRPHPQGQQPRWPLAVSAEKRLKELDLELPAVTPPVANYVNAVRAGNLLFLAGKGGRAGADGKRPQGKIGREYTVEQGYQ